MLTVARVLHEGDYFHDNFNLWQVREVNMASKLVQIESAWCHKNGEPVSIKELPIEVFDAEFHFIRRGTLTP